MPQFDLQSVKEKIILGALGRWERKYSRDEAINMLLEGDIYPETGVWICFDRKPD